MVAHCIEPTEYESVGSCGFAGVLGMRTILPAGTLILNDCAVINYYIVRLVIIYRAFGAELD